MGASLSALPLSNGLSALSSACVRVRIPSSSLAEQANELSASGNQGASTEFIPLCSLSTAAVK